MSKKPNVTNDMLERSEVDVLRSGLVRPGPKAWASCAALGLHPSNEAFELLVDLAHSPSWNYRHAATRAIATHRLGRSAGSLLIALLEDESPYVVRAACDAISQLRLQEAHDAVLSLLHSSDQSTRFTALAALDVLWVPSDFDIVFRVFCEDASNEVRRRAAWALRAHANQENWEILFKAWSRDDLPRHKVWACELAEEFGDSNIRIALESLLLDCDGHVRKSAQLALGKFLKS